MLLALVAVAAATCTPYPPERLANDLTTLQLALQNLDEATFAEAATRVEAGLPCATHALPPIVVSTAFRYLGAGRALAGDATGARRYFRTVAEIEPGFAWDAADLDADSPIRSLYEEERRAAVAPPAPVTDLFLVVPDGAGVWLDGKPLPAPAATLDRPHLLQVVQADRAATVTWVIDGNHFPDELRGARPAPPPAPAPTRGRRAEPAPPPPVSAGDAPVLLERQRPWEKTPLIVIGAVGVAAAGGLYGASFVTHAQFEAATTEADLRRAQTLTDALVVASGVVLAAGIGVGYWGVILDGGGAVGIVAPF